MNNQGLPRSVEIVLALVGLFITAPVLIICACLIKISSRGAIFFCQKRIGLNGKQFTLYKLRTMNPTQTGLMITAASDKRITGVGKILRKTKLDELPELWNVIRGDMSFVGPRPEVPRLVDLHNPLWKETLLVKPGITHPVTLQLRNEEQTLAAVENKEEFYKNVLQPYKLRGYVLYLERRSWLSDFIVIWQTVIAIALPYSVPPFEIESAQFIYADN